MPGSRPDPLEGANRLVVDGTNVLHALARSPEPLPPATLIGRLRAVVPPGVGIVLVLDGTPEPGLVSRRVASGVEVRYAGHEPADRLIERLVGGGSWTGARRPGGRLLEPIAGSEGTVVVTDDIELSGIVRRLGARTARTQWLIERLRRQKLSAPAPGRPGPPAPAARDPDNDEADGRRWAPGRGATRKRGNPRRSPRHG